MITYYQILGITQEASRAEIRGAYGKLAILYHPDTTSDPNAEKKFARASKAYRTLSSEKRRPKYDAKLALPTSIQDLFGRHPLGQKMLQTFLDRAPAEPRPGIDLFEVKPVSEVSIPVPGNIELEWCEIPNHGDPGVNDAPNGSLFIYMRRK